MDGSSQYNHPKLYPHDRVMKAVILPFVPQFVRPNHVTALRLLLIPFVLWLLFSENYAIGIPVFLFAAFTDALDGSIARVRNQITAWGIFFDPVADKLLIGGVALVVALKYFHPVLIFTAIILDILPSVLWASTRRSGMIMMANIWGKIKMVLQVSSITLLLFGILLSLPVLISLGQAVLAVALVFSLIAVITYSL
ncbi:MAG: CDP-alcohol phosphatidyltransferase family protein [Patescibacteria group bacterium]|jgi:CDP-diacylglycerol--glycerol-3-phosphate 3-phosphatidyltransferase